MQVLESVALLQDPQQASYLGLGRLQQFHYNLGWAGQTSRSRLNVLPALQVVPAKAAVKMAFVQWLFASTAMQTHPLCQTPHPLPGESPPLARLESAEATDGWQAVTKSAHSILCSIGLAPLEH